MHQFDRRICGDRCNECDLGFCHFDFTHAYRMGTEDSQKAKDDHLRYFSVRCFVSRFLNSHLVLAILMSPILVPALRVLLELFFWSNLKVVRLTLLVSL